MIPLTLLIYLFYLSVCLSVQRSAIMDKMDKTAFKHVQLCFVFLIPEGL